MISLKKNPCSVRIIWKYLSLPSGKHASNWNSPAVSASFVFHYKLNTQQLRHRTFIISQMGALTSLHKNQSIKGLCSVLETLEKFCFSHIFFPGEHVPPFLHFSIFLLGISLAISLHRRVTVSSKGYVIRLDPSRWSRVLHYSLVLSLISEKNISFYV